MPMLHEYICKSCNDFFEFLRTPEDDVPRCSHCGSTEVDLQLGGRPFTTIVPTYPGAKRRKAGYVHEYVNRPAEKMSVSVPRTKGDS